MLSGFCARRGLDTEVGQPVSLSRAVSNTTSMSLLGLLRLICLTRHVADTADNDFGIRDRVKNHIRIGVCVDPPDIGALSSRPPHERHFGNEVNNMPDAGLHFARTCGDSS